MKKVLLSLGFVVVVAIPALVHAEDPTAIYSQPQDNGSAVVSTDDDANRVIASTFLAEENGHLLSVEMFLRRSASGTCGASLRARIYTASPDAPSGAPDVLLATSTNVFSPLGSPSFPSYTWQFDGTTVLEAGRHYVVEVIPVFGQWCATDFLGSGDVADSKLFSRGANGTGWTFLTDGDLTMTVGGTKSIALNPQQLRADGSAIIAGDNVTSTVVIFKALLENTEGNPVKLQAELRTTTSTFTGIFDGNIFESTFVLPGSLATITTSSLPDQAYEWRMRAVDTVGNTSNWQEFKLLKRGDFFVVSDPQLKSNVAYEQSLGGVPIYVSGLGSQVIAVTFFTGESGYLGTIELEGEHTCLVSFRARVYETAPPGINGLPGTLIAISENLAPDHRIFFPEAMVWKFDGTALLEKHKHYILELTQEPPSQFCSTVFRGASTDRTSSKVYNRGTGSGWTRVSDFDFKLKIRGIRTPVVIVPGIMGSRLSEVANPDNETWPDILNMIDPADPFNHYLDILALNEQGHEYINQKMFPSEVIASVVGFDFYGSLITRFQDQGYMATTTLFTVPYDWRFDIHDELDRLDTKIQDALANSLSGKVDIIVHSMGGVLVKEYLRQATSTEFIDKLILVGVPQLGSPLAFKVLNYGGNMGFELRPFGTVNLYDFLYPDRAKAISQNMPSIYQLLPSRQYIQTVGSYVRDQRNGDLLLTYDGTRQFMLENPVDQRNELLLNRADEFHQALDLEAVNAPEVYNIVGCQNIATIGGFRIYNSFLGNEKYKVHLVNGDGTVAFGSATYQSENYSNYYALHNVTSTDHFDLVRKDGPLALIQNIIDEENKPLPFGVSTSSDPCTNLLSLKNIKTYIFSSHSPVTLQVYDSLGRHTGLDANGDIVLGIPNSDYFMIGDNSFAIVSGNDTYSIETNALSDGEFDLETQIYEGISVSSTAIYLQVPLQSASTTAALTFTGVQGAPLALDSDGDGTFEANVSSTAVLGASSSLDVVSPSITMPNISTYIPVGTDLTFNFSATDDMTGIATIRGKLNGVTVAQNAILSMDIVGNYTLEIEAVDNAGNPTVKEKFFVVHNPAGRKKPEPLHESQ